MPVMALIGQHFLPSLYLLYLLCLIIGLLVCIRVGLQSWHTGVLEDVMDLLSSLLSSQVFHHLKAIFSFRLLVLSWVHWKAFIAIFFFPFQKAIGWTKINQKVGLSLSCLACLHLKALIILFLIISSLWCGNDHVTTFPRLSYFL